MAAAYQRVTEAPMPAKRPPITVPQLAALRRLQRDPAAFVEAGTLGLLRRRKLVGRNVEQHDGRQRTTSPITTAGAILLDFVGHTIPDDMP